MEQFKLNPTGRFSDRVGAYVKYRPGYPRELLGFLRDELGLDERHPVADIGSGTGIFSEFLIKAGSVVVGVEPNREMREAAERLLAAYPRFRSVEGKSEATGLANESVDLITAAQAFHWFEPVATRQEFRRILRPGGHVVLVWNDRRTEGPFDSEYEDLIIRFSIDYRSVNHKDIVEADIRGFLGERGYGRRSFENFQDLDLQGLVGRLASSSYAPNVDHPRYADMVVELTKLFEKYQTDGTVRIAYDTLAYFGELGS